MKRGAPRLPPGLFVFRGGISPIPKRSTLGPSFQSEPLRKSAASPPAAGKLCLYKDLPRRSSSTKTKSRFSAQKPRGEEAVLATLGMTGGEGARYARDDGRGVCQRAACKPGVRSNPSRMLKECFSRASGAKAPS